MSGTVSKIAAERNQKALLELATKPGNDICADCKARNPRWASYNLGIFICVNCASIHRKIGTHVSKVKSLTMDIWTKEQVENMRQIGNVNSNQTHNPDEVRNPPPTNMLDVERDSELEKFIRDKYEFKRFVKLGNRTLADRSAIVAARLGPSRSAASIKLSSSSSSTPSNPPLSQTLPLPRPSIPPSVSAPAEPSRASTLSQDAPTGTTMARSESQPISSQAQPQPPQSTWSGVWSDLASLQGPTQPSTLPLQHLSSITSPPIPSALYPNAGGSSLGASFPTTIGPASLTPSLGVGISQGPDALGLGTGVATQQMPPPFIAGTSTAYPFAHIATQQQAQVHAPQNSFLPTSPFSSSLPQQPSLVHQPQIQQIQQPAYSQPVTNPFFNATAPLPGTLSPQPLAQPQVSLMSNTPSPGPFLGSPFPTPFQQQQQQQQPLFQQPTQTPFQPQPPQFGNMQASGAAVAGNPFTSWLTQQPNTYASTHVGQGSGQWGSTI